MSLLTRHLIDPIVVGIRDLYSWLLSERRALRGLAATRILVGIAAVGILLTNFTSRHVIWGPGSSWAEPYRENSEFGSLLDLYAGDSSAVFTLKYLLLLTVAIAFLIGWRARLMNILLVIGMAGLVERADMLGNQGDNILRIGLTLLFFMSTSEHWSLDARRRARARAREAAGEEFTVAQRGWYGLPLLPGWWTALIHNVALIALACQVFILYTASALYKVQGELWQNGTALHYPLSLGEFGVFPEINALLSANPILLTIMTYFSVFVQLFFAVGLLHPITRRLFLLGVIGLHGGIAVLMGIPWFSLAMLAYDAIFVSDRTYRRIEGLAARAAADFRRRLGFSPDSDPPEDAPRQAGRSDKSTDEQHAGKTIAERRAVTTNR
ncbi:HTTM domain-containing protein [Nesterenkonia xinjiangensis]|uniref:HTTM-like domain-containing protein n=1 Tax=Nesterenkonia xinjiangensis TaxID=225327 RepID=A0A7Z0GLW5_9MICC|nr:HTTM domain-containing protein [Nesterenkonia xinjiangensis]NYJ78390.1 hypothetical protein [Nesterenkonia xinjiangensis]